MCIESMFVLVKGLGLDSFWIQGFVIVPYFDFGPFV